MRPWSVNAISGEYRGLQISRSFSYGLNIVGYCSDDGKSCQVHCHQDILVSSLGLKEMPHNIHRNQRNRISLGCQGQCPLKFAQVLQFLQYSAIYLSIPCQVDFCLTLNWIRFSAVMMLSACVKVFGTSILGTQHYFHISHRIRCPDP